MVHNIESVYRQSILSIQYNGLRRIGFWVNVTFRLGIKSKDAEEEEEDFWH